MIIYLYYDRLRNIFPGCRMWFDRYFRRYWLGNSSAYPIYCTDFGTISLLHMYFCDWAFFVLFFYIYIDNIYIYINTKTGGQPYKQYFEVKPKYTPIFSSPGQRQCELLPFVHYKLSPLYLILWNHWTKLGKSWQVPFKSVSDNHGLHSRWLLLLKIEMSSIVHCCFIVNSNELKF